MKGWSINRASMAAALVAVAAIPATAQDWRAQADAPPSGAYDSGDQQDYRADPSDDASADAGAGRSYDDPQDRAGPGQDDRDQVDQAPPSDGGFDSRDAAPPDDTGPDDAALPPRNEDRGWSNWRSAPPADDSTDSSAAAPDGMDEARPGNESQGWSTWRSGAPAANADDRSSADTNAPDRSDADRDRDATAPDLDANPTQAPGTVNSFSMSETRLGTPPLTGIANRDTAVSACLAAVRARVQGGAGASRADGINGDWMVSGATGDGRTFYCAVRRGMIDNVQFGS